MQELKTLIDKASEVCGSDKALAHRMGIYISDVSSLRNGRRPFSPEIAAELADIAGEDAVQAAIDAIIIRAKGTRKEGVMRAVLGKGLAAGVAAVWLLSYSGGSNFAMEKVAKTENLFTNVYIVLSSVVGWVAQKIQEYLLFRMRLDAHV